MQATATTTTALRRLPSAPTPKPPRATDRSRHDPLHNLDDAVESVTGTDLRLIYGMAAPMLLVIAVIIALVLSPSYWLVAATLALELCCLGLIVTKLLAMLNEPDPDPPSEGVA